MKAIPLLILVLFVSCSKESLNQKPYYRFDSEDDPYLFEIPVNVDNKIQFKNEEGTILTYSLVWNKIEKKDITYGTFWGTTSRLVYYYDQQTVEFKSEDYATYAHSIILELIKNDNDALEGGFYLDRWNANEHCCSPAVYYFIDEVITSTITYDNVVYEKVITFNSESVVEELEDDLPINVNRVYIDLKKGLIGFDDLENNKWRLLKPR